MKTRVLVLGAGFGGLELSTLLSEELGDEIDVTLIESIDPLGPFGAKEASEGALHGFAPALAAAICDAVGLRPRELPVTPDRLFEALHARRRRERVRARRVEPEQAMP